MLFNSLQFAVFFIIVYILYLSFNHKWQNRLLLLASCVFYAAWDWRFLSLIFISITTDYFCSVKVYESSSERIKKRFLILSILVNLSILGFFKYFNFFAANLQALLGYFSLTAHPLLLNIILPVGISFYTLKTMSYTIDVYTNKIKPTRSYPDYALFVTFFPLLLAGPIMRAGELLPQIVSPRKLRLNQFYEGCYLIFWGLFQKVFVADNLAKIADSLFGVPAPYSGVNVLLALYAFAFQIYCDFAGYSNIARGLGKCMGFDIMINFNLPYFATNPQDFWNRWHISLSKWLRDYLYTPIAFVKRNWGNGGGVFALLVTLILCGLWHGAAWTFVIWGAYWGILLIVHRLLNPFLKKIPSPKNVLVAKAWFALRVIFFFQLVCLGWLIFRVQSIGQVFDVLKGLFFNFDFRMNYAYIRDASFFSFIFFTCILAVVQLFQYMKNDQEIIFKLNPSLQAVFYAVCLWLLITYGNTAKEFIYFQF